MIRFQKATEHDLRCIYEMQIEAFRPLLDKYQDYDTSPAAEPFERTVQRFNFDNVEYHLIMLNDEPIGAVRIRWQDTTYVLVQILIRPEHQNKGYAQEAIREIEKLYPNAKKWVLDTIAQEEKLCYLYEKMGYKKTGDIHPIKEGMDIVDFEKIMPDGNELELYIPQQDDGRFYIKMMSDPETMAYNATWFPPDGCIPNAEEEWEELHSTWNIPESGKFYAFLKRKADGQFVGDVNYHYNAERDWYDMGIVIYASERGKGYGKQGLELLLDQAFRVDGISKLHNDFETTRDAAFRIHKAVGFQEVGEEDGLVQLEITCEEYLEKGDSNNMDIVIKKMETDEEKCGKAYVHWKSWQEAYPGMVSQEYLDNLSIDSCIKMAYQYPDNIYVAKDDDRVVGFVAYGKERWEEDLTDHGEIYAIYVLSEYYGTGVGEKLMQIALDAISEYPRVTVLVLKDNARAIRFYEKFGFKHDGKVIADETLRTEEIRMIMER